MKRGTVPQTAQKKDRHRVQRAAHRAAARAAQRNVEIIGKPAGQADMPPVPEIAQRYSLIRMVKISAQPHTQQGGSPHRNIRIAGKIPVDLPGKQYGGQYGSGAGRCAGGCIDGVYKDRCCVGQQQLFAKAAQDIQPSPAVRPAGRVAQLRQKIGAALNGPGHKLREKADKQRVVTKMTLRCQPAAVYIYDIAERLKGVEGDARRQQKRGSRAEKTGVFENAKAAKTEYCRTAEPKLSADPAFTVADGQRCGVGAQRNARQQRQGLRTAERVKPKAGRKQQSPACAGWQKAVQQYHQRQTQHKSGCSKIHRLPPFGQSAAVQGMSRQSSSVWVGILHTSAASTSTPPAAIPAVQAQPKRRVSRASAVHSTVISSKAVMASVPPSAVRPLRQ